MHAPIPRRNSRHAFISLLLVAFAFRALIPAGFMPSTERPFTLELCPDTFPAQLLARTQGGHSGGASDASHGALTAGQQHHLHSYASASTPETSQGVPHAGDAHALHAAHAEHTSSAEAVNGKAPDEDSSHGHGTLRAEYCVFAAAAASSGPAPYITLLPAEIARAAIPDSLRAFALPVSWQYRVQQPRAPPALS